MPLVQARCLAHMMDSCKAVFRIWMWSQQMPLLGRAWLPLLRENSCAPGAGALPCSHDEQLLISLMHLASPQHRVTGERMKE